jgi:hypothetical protein
MAKRLFR